MEEDLPQPLEPAAVPPEEGTLPPDGSAPPAERTPFWNYHDLLLFIGLMVAGGVAAALAAKFLFSVFRIPTTVAALEPLVAQTLLDVFAFAVLAAMFRLQYDRPFWPSLAWVPARTPPLWPVICGFAAAIAVGFLAYVIHLPTAANPMTRLLQGRGSVLLMAAFGVTLAPLFEELVFRGFLQPLLVRSLGAVLGVLLTALPFGLLHFSEYGNSWRHAALICGAGAAFGWMRQSTGSTRASTLMHASYNALNFVALFAGREDLPH